MIFGNLGALAQTDIKRLLAYSSIAQAGYIVVALAGLTPADPSGLRYAIYYLTAYMFMNLGAFAVVAAPLARSRRGLVALVPFAGTLARAVSPRLRCDLLLALAGIPPTAGFTGKILILASDGKDAGCICLAGCLIT